MPEQQGTLDFRADRARIDQLDRSIIALLRQRLEISRSIQQRRTKTGGARIAEGREEVVIGRYRDALGGTGGALAETLLRLCRGTEPGRTRT
ncbi:chorismate mutase [Amycolatopsis sp. QT-25]|uniref:chorismate mutase n=1 Tax=Amycolatopsis sp. QT-25 TaxID=3034022 RepID=UPI0023EC9FD5|nr:chorismate mutase [Amycolatopsis sp. QT-25]WET76308.1 chorismate mutase [Amycolatopsis sp. QT-25]